MCHFWEFPTTRIDATLKKLSEQKEFRDDTLLKKLGELAHLNAKLAVALVEGNLKIWEESE